MFLRVKGKIFIINRLPIITSTIRILPPYRRGEDGNITKASRELSIIILFFGIVLCYYARKQYKVNQSYLLPVVDFLVQYGYSLLEPS